MKTLKSLFIGLFLSTTILSVFAPDIAQAQSITSFMQERSEQIQETFQNALFDSAKNEVLDDMSALIPLMAFLMVVNIFSVLYKSGPDKMLLEMAKMAFWAFIASCIMGGSFYKETNIGSMFSVHKNICGSEFNYDGGVSLDRDLFNFVKYAADDFACGLYQSNVNKRYNQAVSDMFLVLTDLKSIPSECMSQAVSAGGGSSDYQSVLSCIHNYQNKSAAQQAAASCAGKSSLSGIACNMFEIVSMIHSFGTKVIVEIFLLIIQIIVQVVQFIMMFAMIIGVAGSLLMLKLISPFLVLESVRGRVLTAVKVPLAVAFYGFTQKTLLFFITGLMNAVTSASIVSFGKFAVSGGVDGILVVYLMVAMACLALMTMQIVVILKVPKFALMLVNLSLHELVNIGGEMLKAAMGMSQAAGMAIATGGIGAVAGASAAVAGNAAQNGASWIGSKMGSAGAMLGMGPSNGPSKGGNGGDPRVNRSGRTRLPDNGMPLVTGSDSGPGGSSPSSTSAPASGFNGPAAPSPSERDIPKKKPGTKPAASPVAAPESVPDDETSPKPIIVGPAASAPRAIVSSQPVSNVVSPAGPNGAPTIVPGAILSKQTSDVIHPAAAPDQASAPTTSDGGETTSPAYSASAAVNQSSDGSGEGAMPAASGAPRSGRGGNSRARRGRGSNPITSTPKSAKDIQAEALSKATNFEEYQATKDQFDKSDTPEVKNKKKAQDATFGTFGTKQGRKDLAKAVVIGGAKVVNSLVMDALDGPGKEMSASSFTAGNNDIKGAFDKGAARYGEFREMVEGEERKRQTSAEAGVETANQTEGLTNSIMSESEYKDLMINLDGVIAGAVDENTQAEILRKVEAGKRAPGVNESAALMSKYEQALTANETFKSGQDQIKQNSQEFTKILTFMTSKNELSDADINSLLNVMSLPINAEASRLYTSLKVRLEALMKAQMLKSSNVKIKK